MCKKENSIEPTDNFRSCKTMESTSRNSTAVGDVARCAEHRYLSALSFHATNTHSLEITRPTITNCPDGGHDLNIRGSIEEVKELVSILTGNSVETLSFLDGNAKDGNLKVRIDVKSGKTISGDTIDNHAANSNRSPDCQVNLLALTNPDCQVTPEAHKKLNLQRRLFQETGVLVGIATAKGIQRIEEKNKKYIESNESSEEE
ncbi:MAG: hypothetical protein HHJ17_18235 [Rhodoferax sp.]|uniref:hypothetical protein n=1 Tax=Rhodoferax sp. TaxID=50421 RepID=UPI0017AACDB2|nr:hypothetical protein [Rhodoferax sp.]NMM15461.1 hypothetical protein [Rhodoferax sp.]